MKPAPFKFFAPGSVQEAAELLAEHGPDAKVLAGGQSLIPTMNFRMAQPAVLVDINRIPDLAHIARDEGGAVLIGAMTRLAQAERDETVARHAPLMHAAMPHIAHPQIRNRGTIGGSIAHADPAAELPAVTMALRARYRIRNRSGERWVEANDFYVGLFATILEPGDLLVEIAIPPRPPRSGFAFREVSRRHGDYAMAGVATALTLDTNGRVDDLRMVFFSVGERPMPAAAAAAMLKGQEPTPELIRAAAEIAGREDVDPGSDIHASSDFRRHLAKVLARDTMMAAAERARNGGTTAGPR